MKTLFHLAGKLFAATIIMISGCSKSNDSVFTFANTTWKLTNETVVGCSDPSGNHNLPCTSSCPVLKFTSSTYSVTVNSTLVESGTYSINGSKITITETGSSPRVDTFTLSGTTLTIVSPAESDGCVKTITLLKQ